jgi:hypothetical protein
MTIPRGIRNNNPGNVDYHPSSDPWNGLDDPPSDGRFCRFVDPEHGIRVIAKLLRAYQDYHRLNTVRGIINRWAPPNENDTGAYVAGVAKMIGVGPDEEISVRGPHIMAGLIKAIIQHENGQQPYSDAVISRGIAMAA